MYFMFIDVPPLFELTCLEENLLNHLAILYAVTDTDRYWCHNLLGQVLKRNS